jgi:hypothetical protein
MIRGQIKERKPFQWTGKCTEEFKASRSGNSGQGVLALFIP